MLRIITELYNEGIDEGLRVIVEWCPAHVGLHGNEMADREAKSGLSHATIECEIPLAPSELQAISRKRMLSKWREEYARKQALTGRAGGKVNTDCPVKYSSSIRIDKCITRLRLGTSMLPGSVGHHILEISPLCSDCNTRNNADHVLLSCKSYDKQRQELLHRMNKRIGSITTAEILFPEKSQAKVTFSALCKFLKDCKLEQHI